MSFLARSAKHFLVTKAARQVREELEKAGLGNLKAIADAGRSIMGVYLNGCSPEEKKRIRQDNKILVKLGVTPEMVLNEVAGQNKELADIMEKREAYKRSELKIFERFLKEE